MVPALDRLDSDVCVPQLGHTTGYAHEGPQSFVDTGLVTRTSPTLSTVSLVWFASVMR